MKPGSVLEAIVELAHERGLEQESIIEAIEDAIVGAAYRKYKNYRTIEATFNRQTGEIDLMHYKVVVERVEDPDNEISLDSVKKLDPLAECGDEVEYEIDAKEFSKVIAQTARQLIFQKIREAERESVLDKYSDKKGDIVHGTVSRIERGKVIIMIGNTAEAMLDRYEQIPHEKLQPGDNVRAYLLDLQSEGRGPQLIVSRTHPNFLMKLFEVEVPEVYEGIIDVMAAAREPGKRAKVAVYTNDPDVDPVGACVGPRGSRVQAIVSELCDERIDVVEWSNDLEQFISNALAPADIMRIDLDVEKKVADIQIAQDQLSLAIGKQGQNVRLASKLTGIMINITAWEPGNELKDLEASFAETENKSEAKNAEAAGAEDETPVEEAAQVDKSSETNDAGLAENQDVPTESAPEDQDATDANQNSSDESMSKAEKDNV
ncbi:MAG: transcription termination factor NusA [Proteobacteria bacterium]|nr:transcription termination factor NusA [Pseudomonadota bacterium]